MVGRHVPHDEVHVRKDRRNACTGDRHFVLLPDAGHGARGRAWPRAAPPDELYGSAGFGRIQSLPDARAVRFRREHRDAAALSARDARCVHECQGSALEIQMGAGARAGDLPRSPQMAGREGISDRAGDRRICHDARLGLFDVPLRHTARS